MTRTLAIDWDGTWTADPVLFAHLAKAAKSRGWQVYVVTNRPPSDRVPLEAAVAVVVYCDGRPKREACAALGIAVDVWVDDMPVLVDFGQAGLDALRARTQKGPPGGGPVLPHCG